MENKKNVILSISTVLTVVLISVFVFYKTNSPNSTNSPSPTVSGDIIPTNNISPSATPVSDTTPKCQLSGEIIFDGTAFVHVGSQEFNYQNILDKQDIIKWQISPAGENFDIGPNRTSGLKLPTGSDYLTVFFNKITPKYNKYELSASIDYVAVVDNAAKILNAKCSGKTILTIK